MKFLKVLAVFLAAVPALAQTPEFAKGTVIRGLMKDYAPAEDPGVVSVTAITRPVSSSVSLG